MRSFIFLNPTQINTLPKSPGVYAFKIKRDIVYVGKATNLRERAKNHFKNPTHKDNFFITKVQKIGYITTLSEVEALILEAQLIKRYKPKYNVIWKDDKNYFYVIITNEEFPRIIVEHQIKVVKLLGTKIKKCFGPFVDGSAIKKTLQLLRKIFPYYTTAKHPKKLCQWCHLGLCPGPNYNKKQYQQNIKNIMKILQGETQRVLTLLKKDMLSAVAKKEFEKAAEIRNQFLSLEKVTLNARVISLSEDKLTTQWNDIQKNISNTFSIKGGVHRIEFYDISNIQGKFAAGAMVVFSEGKKDKKEYRKFKIKYKNTPDDIGMIKEIIARRFTHKEWKQPDLIFVDGGKAHFSEIERFLKRQNLKTKVVAVTKDKKHRATKLYFSNTKKPIYLSSLTPSLRNFILNINEETHRLAISYHRKLRFLDLKRIS